MLLIDGRLLFQSQGLSSTVACDIPYTDSRRCDTNLLDLLTCSLRTGVRGGAAAMGLSARPPGCRVATGRRCV